MQSAVEMGKLMIPVAKPMDSGEYICRVVGAPGSFEDNARLEVVPSKFPAMNFIQEIYTMNGQAL